MQPVKLNETFILNYLEANIKNANSKIVKFEKDLNEDPANAFEWADDVMKLAAEKAVMTSVKHMLFGINDSKTKMIGEVIAILHDKLMFETQDLCNSSKCTVIMKQNKIIAISKVYRMLLDYVTQSTL